MKVLTNLIVSIMFLSGCSLIDGYNTYEDKTRGFSIKYPDDWTLQEDDNPDTPILVTFYKSPSGTNVSVAYSKLQRVTDLKHLVEINFNTLKKHDNFREFSSGYEYVHKLQGYRIVFSHTYNGSEYKVMMYSLVSGTNFYVITCTSTPESFDADQETFNKIIKRFKFRI
jgi:hypothetical protein